VRLTFTTPNVIPQIVRSNPNTNHARP
jgi:hypothetical protein